MAIYVTGDTHCPLDIHKLANKNLANLNLKTKDDYLIILGDFGAVWDDSKTDQYWLEWLNNKPFTTLFISGNHENFDLLDKYPIEWWNGGVIQKIKSSVFYLLDGEIFDLEDKHFFIMGGAESTDKEYRIQGKSWWKQELPNYETIEKGRYYLLRPLKQLYILTHCIGNKYEKVITSNPIQNRLTDFLDDIDSYNYLEFKHWYFGHYHLDLEIDGKHTCVYNKIIEII